MKTDTLIIGSGLAGLYTALHAAQTGSVIIVSRGRIDSASSSYWAQGGIAAAVGLDDTPELLVQDTLRVGRGLCNEQAVRILAQEGPRHILRLRDLGVEFYAPGGKLDLGLEAGHSRRRIVHALGGGTGKAIVDAVLPHVLQHPNITILDQNEVYGLISDGESCYGAYTRSGTVQAPKTILTTGGAASLFERSTNPPGSIGSGWAMAYEAGAVLQDLEFVQFHPTALVSDTHPGQLISEAVRGEGAHLVDKNGHRFMPESHEAAELAPRDELTRAIVAQMRKTDHDCVYLTLAHLDKDRVNLLFSRISTLIKRSGYDLATDLIPVAPAAHYCMGGVQTDTHGQTSLNGLFAVGEVASTGVHGANRLASNSLMECLVFGERAGLCTSDPGQMPELNQPEFLPKAQRETIGKVKAQLWEGAGVLRDQKRLEHLLAQEVSNEAELVAHLIAKSALERIESRGGHFRTDFPHEDLEWKHHTSLIRE